MTEAYPLHWPAGWPRTTRRSEARFDVTPDRARRDLLLQVERLGARYPVISTNIKLRRDGIPYADEMRRKIEDPGVAVYFERHGKQMVFACDKWTQVHHNIRAVTKTIDALRGIERWGASSMLERSLSAFEALPAPKTPWDILRVPPGSSVDAIKAAFRKRAQVAHPDHGGSDAAMAELNWAYHEAMRAA